MLDEFVKAGAPEEILYVSQPHIGTFRLVGMVEKMRAQIVALGGEIRFQQRVADLLIEAGAMRGVDAAPRASSIAADHVVLALGHSARDTFEMLHRRGVFMEAKPFSIGFRIEHPQGVIDRARYGAERRASAPRRGRLQAGAPRQQRPLGLQLLHVPGRHRGRGHLRAERVVTNGMSQYSRNERNANAGIVVGIAPQDYRQDGRPGPVARSTASPSSATGSRAPSRWAAAATSRPGQLVGDFLRRPALQRAWAACCRPTSRACDDRPGATGHASLPDYAIEAIREALPAFERQIEGFAMPDAVLTGVETRTSSPLRITRGKDFQSLNVAGLYPAGEGAGYAGGILSAAVDGIEVAEALSQRLLGFGGAGRRLAEAAVDVRDLGGDAAGQVRQQEGGGVADVVDRHVAAHRRLRRRSRPAACRCP